MVRGELLGLRGRPAQASRRRRRPAAPDPLQAPRPGLIRILSAYERPPLGGDGRLTYLLVHGSMDRATSFRRLEARLGEATIISYDRRGYAGSEMHPATETFSDQVADLIEVLAGRPVVALGHSFGGGVVLAAAQQHPELIRAAVVWEPPMPWQSAWPATSAGAAVVADGRDPADVAEAFMRTMVGDRIWDRLPAATHQARRREGVALVAEMRALRSAVPWDPAEITIPVLVGTGGASREHHRRSAEVLARALPHGELVVLAEARHGAHLSHPGQLAAMLREAARRSGLDAGVGPAPGAEVWTAPGAEVWTAPGAEVCTAPGGAASSTRSADDEEDPT